MKILEESLTPAVRDICENGKFSLDRYGCILVELRYLGLILMDIKA